MSLNEIIQTLSIAYRHAETCAHADDATRLQYVEAYGRLAQQVEFALADLDALLDELVEAGSEFA